MTEQELTALGPLEVFRRLELALYGKDGNTWEVGRAQAVMAVINQVINDRESLKAERDALKAQLREVKNWVGALEDAMNPQDVAGIAARLKREA